MAAARSIGSLTVSFGLVAIPVKLFSATQAGNAISFNLLHKTCGSRLMQQLHYAADVRRSNEIEVPKPEVKPAELKLAQQLIDQQTQPKFDPETYKDELHARLEGAIQKKVEGQEISVAEPAPEGDGKVIDLMEALRASLEKSEKARAEAQGFGPRKAPKRVEEPAKVARKAGKR